MKNKSIEQTTLVLTGGGSGGHITPLLSLAQELKKASSPPKVVYVGLKGEKVDGLESQYKLFDEVYFIPSGKFRRYHGESLISHLLDVKTLALNARDALRVLRGIISARRLLKKLDPVVVFSKGGFVVVPVGIAAHRLNIPIVTHDSDTMPGLANRIIAKWAKIHAVGMPPEYYSYPKNKMRYTGIPISNSFTPPSNSQIEIYKKQLCIAPSSTVLLVAGGGQGSRIVNKMITGVAPDLFKKIPNLHILHLSGKGNESETKSEYQQNLSSEQIKKVSVVGFTDEFYKYSAVSDVVIARTGATTLAELALQSRAVVTIPSPFLSGGHQLKNADMLKKQHAAKVVPEDSTPEELLKVLEVLLTDNSARRNLAASLHTLAKPDAAKDIADLLINFTTEG